MAVSAVQLVCGRGLKRLIDAVAINEIAVIFETACTGKLEHF